MSKEKFMRSFRLDVSTIVKLQHLQKIYSVRTGFDVSQADILKRLINNEYDALDDYLKMND